VDLRAGDLAAFATARLAAVFFATFADFLVVLPVNVVAPTEPYP